MRTLMESYKAGVISEGIVRLEKIQAAEKNYTPEVEKVKNGFVSANVPDMEKQLKISQIWRKVRNESRQF